MSSNGGSDHTPHAKNTVVGLANYEATGYVPRKALTVGRLLLITLPFLRQYGSQNIQKCARGRHLDYTRALCQCENRLVPCLAPLCVLMRSNANEGTDARAKLDGGAALQSHQQSTCERARECGIGCVGVLICRFAYNFTLP